jgi:hypothetical protein
MDRLNQLFDSQQFERAFGTATNFAGNEAQPGPVELLERVAAAARTGFAWDESDFGPPPFGVGIGSN